MIAGIVGHEIINGNRYPVPSSWVWQGSKILRDGESMLVTGDTSTESGKTRKLDILLSARRRAGAEVAMR